MGFWIYRSQVQIPAARLFRRVITLSKLLVFIQSPARRDLKWSVWHCRYCNASGQNNRLSIECRFQDRYLNAIIIIIYYEVLIAQAIEQELSR